MNCIDISIRTPWGRADLAEFEPWLKAQPLTYPNYEEWVSKAMLQLHGGEKDVLLAYEHGSLVANALYQDHRTVPGLTELKNLRVAPHVRRRKYMTFMLKQIEHAAHEYGRRGVIMDVRADQPETLEFAVNTGYVPYVVRPLYADGAEDFIMIKLLQEPTSDHHSLLPAAFQPDPLRAQERLNEVLEDHHAQKPRIHP